MVSVAGLTLVLVETDSSQAAGFVTWDNDLLGTATNDGVGQVGVIHSIRLEPAPRPLNNRLGWDGSEFAQRDRLTDPVRGDDDDVQTELEAVSRSDARRMAMAVWPNVTSDTFFALNIGSAISPKGAEVVLRRDR